MKKLSKGEQTRSRIIEASAQAFGRSGCDGASLRSIALQVGLTEPALYRHFADKQQLYRATLRHAAAVLEDCLDACLSESDGPAEVLELGNILLDTMLATPFLSALVQQLLAAGSDDLGAGLFQRWSKGCRELNLPGESSLILLNLLSQCCGFVRAREGLINFWGEDRYRQVIEPEQREQLRWLLRGWMLR